MPITSFKHNNYINGVAWSPDGKFIASCDNDQLVYVWPVASDRLASKSSIVYRGHKGGFLFSSVYAVAWSPDGRSIASSASDGTVQIWDPISGHQEQIFKGHTNSSGPAVNTVAWSPDGHYLASAGTDGQILIWHANTLQIVQRYARPGTTFYDLSWSPDGKHLAIGSSDNTAIILNYPDDQQADPVTTVYTGHTDRVMSISWSPDGRFIASGSADKTVQIWQPIQTNQNIFIYKGHSKQINSVAWLTIATVGLRQRRRYRQSLGSRVADGHRVTKSNVFAWKVHHTQGRIQSKRLTVAASPCARGPVLHRPTCHPPPRRPVHPTTCHPSPRGPNRHQPKVRMSFLAREQRVAGKGISCDERVGAARKRLP